MRVSTSEIPAASVSREMVEGWPKQESVIHGFRASEGMGRGGSFLQRLSGSLRTVWLEH